MKKKRIENEIPQKVEEEPLEEKKELCSHLINDEVCDEYKFDYYKLLDQRGIIKVNTKVYSYVCLCLNCTEILHPKAKIDEHFNEKKHKLFLNLTNWKLICLECKSQYDISLADKILKYRIICNLLNELEIFPPSNKLILSEDEIFKVKYETYLGQEVRLVGNIEELGSWDPKKSILMTTNNDIYPYWISTQEITGPIGMGILYKYLIYDNHLKKFIWENEDQNRFFEIEHPGKFEIEKKKEKKLGLLKRLKIMKIFHIFLLLMLMIIVKIYTFKNILF